jgi:hypothetical protein
VELLEHGLVQITLVSHRRSHQSVGTLNGATFYITGVQLEKGSVQATSFDYRPYGTELALCQRYLPAISFAGGANPYIGAGMAFGTTAAYYTISFPVTPRVPPTGLTVSSASHFSGFLAGTSTSVCTGFTFAGASWLAEGNTPEPAEENT